MPEISRRTFLAGAGAATAFPSVGSLVAASGSVQANGKPLRARDLGIPFEGTPGKLNAITDVPGVLVGQTTFIAGEGKDAIRTGVTAIFPRAELGYYPASSFVLSGDAEMFGSIFADEFGMLRSPIMFTGTASNGTIYTSVIKWSAKKFPDNPVHIPVVADTWDADLSNYLAFPLQEKHVFAALDGAKSGPVDEGNVGGGTGMICHEFKGGIGTSSRVLADKHGGYTVGVLVQANYGARADLRIAGVPIGKEIRDLMPEGLEDLSAESDLRSDDSGSVLVAIATNAPVNTTTLKAMAKRSMMGIARSGSASSPFSGDVALAFATTSLARDKKTNLLKTETLFQYAAEPLYYAVVRATEEAVINALVAAKTMVGLNGGKVYALPHDRVRELLARYNRKST